MSQDMISFGCPSCGVQLRVPATMAGVKGPCPACSHPIEAPPLEVPGGAHPGSPAPPSATPAPAPQPATSPLSQGLLDQPSGGSPALPPYSPPPQPDQTLHPTEPFAPPGHLSADPAPLPDPGSMPGGNFPQIPGDPIQDVPDPFPNAAPYSTQGPPHSGFEPPNPLPSASGPVDPLSSPPPPTTPPAGFPVKDGLDPMGLPPAGSYSDPPPPANFGGFPPVPGPLPGGESPLGGPPPAQGPGGPGFPQGPPTDPYGPPPGSEFPQAPGPGSDPLASAAPLDSFPPSSNFPDPGISPVPDMGMAASNPGPPNQGIPGQPKDTALPPGFAPSPKPGEPSPQNTLPLNPSEPIQGGLSPIDQATNEQTQQEEDESELRRPRWPGIVFPLLLIVLTAIMVYLVLDLSELLPNSRTETKTPPTSEKPKENVKERDRKPTRGGVGKASIESAPPGPGEKPGSVEPIIVEPPKPAGKLIEEGDLSREGEAPLAPEVDLSGLKSPKAAVSLTERNSRVLARFLDATSLAGRRDLMTKSRRTDAELSSGPLAGPLPDYVHTRPLLFMENDAEGLTEYFFEVYFQTNPDVIASPLTVQLTEWGDGKIKVHTDAFLDLYTDDIQDFAKSPQEGERTFHVIADAYKHCFDDNIPGAKNKSYIKLRSHRSEIALARAYFGRDSKLSEQIAHPKGLPWGSDGDVTVTVRWNREEPTQPFLELVRIDGFSWNP